MSQLHTRHDRDTRSITIAPQVITATGGVTSSTTIVTITTTTYPKADDSVKLESQNESCSEADDEDATSVRSESSQSENYSHGASDLHHGKYSHSISGLHDIIGSHGVTHSHDANSFRGENITDGPGSFVCIHCERRQPALLQGFSVCLLCISDWRWCKSGNHNRPGAEFMWDRAEHDRCIHCLLDIISL